MLLKVYIQLFPIYFSVIGLCIRRSTHDIIIPANVSKGVDTWEDSVNPRYSRVELVLGSQGVDQLNQSRVLIIGANDLALKVITHLVRSGIGSIDIYDTDAKVCNGLIQKVKILHSNANVRFMVDFDRDYDFVICSNTNLQSAIDLNKKLRGRSKFICAHSKGVYGLIISDFGEKHLIARESDYQYPEHSCKLIKTGIFITCLELKLDSKADVLYKRGDRIQITYPNYLLKHGQSNINVKNCTIMNVRVDDDKLLLYINLNTKEWPEMTISIKKIDKERYMRFDEIGNIVENVLGYGGVLNKIRDILFKTAITKDDILIISRDKVNVKEIVKEFFNDLSSGRDSFLTSLNIPATTTLIGALVAQEVIKGITNLYTPSKLIIVDRSDVFKDLNGNVVDVEIANEIVKKVSDYSYLLVGAGALGCDYLQLFAEMNIKNVLVVDSDVVELSNLSRQCLFTERDIGKFKAKTAIENLKILYGREFKNYKALNREFDENNNFSPTVTVSAVDNLLTRIQLDNYSIEHKTHFIEAGIHGMQCTTSISVPFLTESYSTTMGNDIGYDKHNSCTVKGIPKTLEDAVFYSMELYNWIFKIQPRILEDFFNDPVRTIKFSLKCGDLSNVLPIILEHCEILSSSDDIILLKNISKWANRIYNKYINHDSELKQQWLTSIINLKFKALLRGNHTIKDLPNVLKLRDQYKHHLKGYATNADVKGLMRYRIKDLDFVEDEDSIDFIYTTSNIRACKYKINQKDKLSILKIAKNIVPAISTTVSVATSMSLFELYKIALLTRMEHKVPLTSDELNNRTKLSYGDLNISLFNPEYKIWFAYNKNTLECYNRNKLILILKPFNYFKTNGMSNVFNNNFFNLSVMKYYRNYPSPPQIFTLDNYNAWLHGISFSFWDYMIINDGVTANDYLKGTSSVTLGELACVVGHLFDVKVLKLAFDTDLIEISNDNHNKSLRDTIKKDCAIIKLIATDNQTKEDIELPYIKYNK